MAEQNLPISDADWPEAIADMREGFAGKLNVYRVMAHNPALLKAWATLRQHVVLDSALTEQQKEIVILRTGHRWGSEYEWAHHVYRGRKVGLSEERIARAALPFEISPTADDEDSALIEATDALLIKGRLDAATRDRLSKFLSNEAIIDIMATVGMYTTLAFLVNSFATPVDEDVQAALAQAAG